MKRANLPCHVTQWRISNKPAKKSAPKEKPPRIPNHARAVTTGTFVTVKDGRRVMRFYHSGEPLEGQLQ